MEPPLSKQPCHRNFGPGKFGPGGPKSPILFRRHFGLRTKITSDFGPTPDILVRGSLLWTKISDIDFGPPDHNHK